MGDVLQCQSQDLLLLFIIKYYFSFFKEREKYGLRFSLLFSKTVECGLCGVLSSLPLFLFSSQLILSNQVNQSSTRDADMKGIKYSHPKKDRLDMITKFGWCCDGLVVASGVVLVCFCYYCCAAIAQPLPSLRSHLVVSQVLFCFFFFLASCFAPPPPLFF